ncbi:MAG: tetratricopeptide repeat protein [Chloroflexota bacterium]
MLPLEEIVDEIKNSLDFLETDLRDVPERHRSLRAVADYSWNLLNEDEQEIFIKLSIFRNGFEREAAQKIAGASLRNLTNLVNKSLIVREPTGRYYMHKLLRQYGEDRFADHDSNMDTHMAFADYYIALTQKLFESLQSSKEASAIKLLDLELDNIRYLWRKGQAYGKYEKVDQLQDVLFYYYLTTAKFTEGAEVFAGLAEAMAKDNQRDAIYWRAILRYAMLIGRQGQYDEALTIAHDALESDFAFNDLDRSAIDLIIGNLMMSIGNYEASEEALTHGITLMEDEAFWYYPALHSSLGYLKFLQGDLRTARAIYEDITATAEKVSYAPTTVANLKNNFGEVLQKLGDYNRAKTLYEESLELSYDPYNPRWIAVTKLNIAGIHFLQANYQQARDLLEEGHNLYCEIGDRWGIAHALSNLGNVAIASGDHELASRKFNDALTIRREIGEKRGIADSLSDLANCAMSVGDLNTAKRYMSEVIQIRREIGDRLGMAEALNREGVNLLLSGDDVNEARALILEALEIGEASGSSFVYAQSNAALGEAALIEGKYNEATDYFKRVLRELDADEAPLPMILWALLGIARIKVEHGDYTSALQMVTLILRYPRNYIAIIEQRATEMLDMLTQQMPENDVQSTMTATKSLILRHYIRDLLTEQSTV